MVLTQTITQVDKDSLTLTYSPNISFWLVLQFCYPCVGSLIPLLVLIIDTMHSPINQTNGLLKGNWISWCEFGELWMNFVLTCLIWLWLQLRQCRSWSSPWKFPKGWAGMEIHVLQLVGTHGRAWHVISLQIILDLSLLTCMVLSHLRDHSTSWLLNLVAKHHNFVLKC